jgi:hypothetical protein
LHSARQPEQDFIGKSTLAELLKAGLREAEQIRPSGGLPMAKAADKKEERESACRVKNQRPRKTLGFQTPASKLHASVASTA